MTTEFKIEKGIPVPIKGPDAVNFPLASMEVNDSFLIDKNDYQKLKYQTKKLANWKFTTRTIGDKHIRCWRVA